MIVEASERFRTGINGKVYDTQIHPKVKRAQQAHDAQLKRIADRKLEKAQAEHNAAWQHKQY